MAALESKFAGMEEEITVLKTEIAGLRATTPGDQEAPPNTGRSVPPVTGTISLDRHSYPIPFSGESFRDGNGAYLAQHDLTVYIRVNDADWNIYTATRDTISSDLLTVSVVRGSEIYPITIDSVNLIEVTSNSGIFEVELFIAYDDGPAGRILYGDVLQVEYRDPVDATGEMNSVTESAAFYLHSANLNLGDNVVLIDSVLGLGFEELDLNLDSRIQETYTLDLIKWNSDVLNATLGGYTGFEPSDAVLRESSENSGVFYMDIKIPAELGGDPLGRGEEVVVSYVDYSWPGADYVGSEAQNVTRTAFVSNHGVTVELDQEVYTWTDKVYITVTSPYHNTDPGLINEIESSNADYADVRTDLGTIGNYKFVETGPDTDIFTGEVTLIGFDYDVDGDDETGTEYDGFDNPQRSTSPHGSGPTNGYLKADNTDLIYVMVCVTEEICGEDTADIQWNMGEIQWVESSHPEERTGVVRVVDPDRDLDPEAVDSFTVYVWAHTGGDIELTVTETNYDTGIFEGTVFFITDGESSDHRLLVANGSTVRAAYYDRTLPFPFPHQSGYTVYVTTTLANTTVLPVKNIPGATLLPAQDTSRGCQNTDSGCFDPAILTIVPGTDVIFIGWGHDIVRGTPTDRSDDGFDMRYNTGGYRHFILDEEGTYDYYCRIHPWMTGQIVVQ